MLQVQPSAGTYLLMGFHLGCTFPSTGHFTGFQPSTISKNIKYQEVIPNGTGSSESQVWDTSIVHSQKSSEAPWRYGRYAHQPHLSCTVELSEFLMLGKGWKMTEVFFFQNLIGNYCKHGFFFGDSYQLYSYQLVVGMKHQ